MHSSPLNSAEIKDADPSWSQRSAYNFTVGPFYLKFHTCRFNQPWVVEYNSMHLLKKIPMYKWTCAVQTYVAQGSTVFFIS